MPRHMFAGANTPDGFCSYFSYVMPIEKASKRVFLKGSSGSGKSTFMKKIAKALEAKNLEADYFHCSNDADSLDCITSDKIGLCVMDGTAPHIFDPEIPKAIDHIIDFARFIDESKVSPYIDEIKLILRQKKQLIDKAYGYLGAAGRIYQTNKRLYEAFLLEPKLHKLLCRIPDVLENHRESRCANRGPVVNRKLFAGSITPDGPVNYADSILQGYKVYGLYAETGMGADKFLSVLQREANSRLISTESFYCPMEPSKPEHVLMPELKLAFTTIDKYSSYKESPDVKIDFGDCADNNSINNLKHGAGQNAELFDALLKKAEETFKLSRTLHDRIEEIYVSSINFDGVNELTAEWIDSILD